MLSRSFSMPSVDLVRDTGRTFGIQRLGAKVSPVCAPGSSCCSREAAPRRTDSASSGRKGDESFLESLTTIDAARPNRRLETSRSSRLPRALGFHEGARSLALNGSRIELPDDRADVCSLRAGRSRRGLEEVARKPLQDFDVPVERAVKLDGGRQRSQRRSRADGDRWVELPPWLAMTLLLPPVPFR